MESGKHEQVIRKQSELLNMRKIGGLTNVLRDEMTLGRQTIPILFPKPRLSTIVRTRHLCMRTSMGMCFFCVFFFSMSVLVTNSKTWVCELLKHSSKLRIDQIGNRNYLLNRGNSFQFLVKLKKYIGEIWLNEIKTLEYLLLQIPDITQIRIFSVGLMMICIISARIILWGVHFFSLVFIELKW